MNCSLAFFSCVNNTFEFTQFRSMILNLHVNMTPYKALVFQPVQHAAGLRDKRENHGKTKKSCAVFQ